MANYEFIEVEACKSIVRCAACHADELGPTITRLFSEIANANQNCDMIGPPMIKYLKWTPPSCEIEAACPISDDSPIAPGFETTTYPACTALYTEHIGPYDTLPQAWLSLWQYVEANGIQGDMPCWDSYVTDPTEEPDANKWITELYVPIRKI